LEYHYSLPFRPHLIIQKKRHPLCDLYLSIKQNINIIIKTQHGESRYDNEFGCFIWNKDYTTVTKVSQWQNELKSFMKGAIVKYEKRLKNVDVALKMDDIEISERFRDQPLKFKKRIVIEIHGTIHHLNEPFEHFEYLYFSPLSIE